MRDKPWFPVVYMFLVTACFSAVLIGFARLTRARVLANERLMFERAVLMAFPKIELPPDAGVHAAFNQLFKEAEEMPGVYLYQPDDRTTGYAVTVAGQGFWAPIRGVAGVQPDLEALTGLAFYDQNETPGLGARIEEPAFRRQFEGLRLGDQEQLIGIRAPSVTLAEHEVHAISGATQTCVRLEKLLNDSLGAWLAERRGRAAP